MGIDPNRVYYHKLTPCLSTLGWRAMNGLFVAEFPLVTQILPQIRVRWTSERLKVCPLSQISIWLSLRGLPFGCR